MISCFRPVVARTAPLSESVTERERPVAPTRNRAIGVLNHSAGRRLSRLKSQRSRDAHGDIGPQRASRLKNSAKRVFSEEGVQRVRVPLAKFSRLLLFLGVKRVLPQPRAVLFDFQLFATRFASQGVVVVAGFLTDCLLMAAYVPTEANPADGPSRASANTLPGDTFCHDFLAAVSAAFGGPSRSSSP